MGCAEILPTEQNLFAVCMKFFIDQTFSVKMAGNWLKFVLWYSPSLKQASTKHSHGACSRDLFYCITLRARANFSQLRVPQRRMPIGIPMSKTALLTLHGSDHSRSLGDVTKSKCYLLFFLDVILLFFSPKKKFWDYVWVTIVLRGYST